MHLPVSYFLVVALFCLPLAVFANVHEYELDNGLKILVKEDHRAPVVVSQIWYKIGSSYEYEGITGISHVLEHMMFKGTEKYGPGEFSRIIAEHGGRENAFTGRDYTAYFQTLESSRLPISFELEADRMRDLKLKKEEFIKEIEVVKEERRLRTEDNPQSFSYEILMASAFQTGVYRHPVIGWMNDLDNMAVSDLHKWYRRWYAPNNATLVVCGDVKAEEVYQLAKQHFGPLLAGEPIKLNLRPEVKQNGIKRVVIKKPAELPYLLMAYKVPTLKSAVTGAKAISEREIYALEVLAGILDGSSSARFVSNLIRGKELAASISAIYSFSSRLDHLFLISATPNLDVSIADLEVAVKAEILDIKNNSIGNGELERVKAKVVANDVFERDSIFYQGMVLGIFETVGLGWRESQKYVESIKAVTAEEVQAVASKYFQDDQLTVAVLEPQVPDSRIDVQKEKGTGHVH